MNGITLPFTVHLFYKVRGWGGGGGGGGGKGVIISTHIRGSFCKLGIYS